MNLSDKKMDKNNSKNNPSVMKCKTRTHPCLYEITQVCYASSDMDCVHSLITTSPFQMNTYKNTHKKSGNTCTTNIQNDKTRQVYMKY